MNVYLKERRQIQDTREKRALVLSECRQRNNCRGCRFFHRPIFSVGPHDNQERCSQWDIIPNWREKQGA
jgi:hypothetical protein